MNSGTFLDIEHAFETCPVHEIADLIHSHALNVDAAVFSRKLGYASHAFAF
ncbi:hypothetical protein BSAF29S_04826 [Bacillus safensis subsp. safensis]